MPFRCDPRFLPPGWVQYMMYDPSMQPPCFVELWGCPSQTSRFRQLSPECTMHVCTRTHHDPNKTKQQNHLAGSPRPASFLDGRAQRKYTFPASIPSHFALCSTAVVFVLLLPLPLLGAGPRLDLHQQAPQSQVRRSPMPWSEQIARAAVCINVFVRLLTLGRTHAMHIHS